MRRILGYPADTPIIGDKIINLHNEWELKSNKDNPLTNGVISQIKEFKVVDFTYPWNLRKAQTVVPVLTATISGDEEKEEYFVNADYNELLTGNPSFTTREEYLLAKRFKTMAPTPLHFNYGYAITCWKAQGSEWNKILGYEEGFPWVADEHIKYLYTLITRAQ